LKANYLINLQDALNKIKHSIENAIETGGTEGKNNLIRTSKPIGLLHDVVKSELIKNNISDKLIAPALGVSRGELSLAGFFKKKDQDVCVMQKGLKPITETLENEGILNGVEDKYGKDFTEKCLSINVRSQLSSCAKNFDTLYERTILEAINLHKRCPKMCLGEFYMITVREYDSSAANRHEVKYRDTKGIQNHIEKYILSFGAINNRVTTNDSFKYERVCLLIVDFSQDTPKYYGSDSELKNDGLLSENSSASINDMNFESFVPTLLKTYSKRFGQTALPFSK
jgi:hypothetical protein